MTAHRLTLALGTTLLALGLTACGGAGVTFGSDGVTVTDGNGSRVSAGSDGVAASDGSGASVTAGADGVAVSDGEGVSVSAGADGVAVTDGSGTSVSAGQDGASVVADDGSVAAASDGDAGVAADGAAGVTGDVTLTGALRFRGTASGACVADGADRVLDLTVGSGHVLRLVVSDGDVSVAVDGGGREWGAVYGVATTPTVVTVAPGRTVVRGARLVAEDGSVVRVDGSFGC